MSNSTATNISSNSTSAIISTPGSYTRRNPQGAATDREDDLHIPNVNSRESTKDKIREVEHIIEELGEWQGADPKTGFQLVKTADGKILKIADLVDDDPAKREKVSAALRDSSAEEQPRSCGHHHRAGDGEGGF